MRVLFFIESSSSSFIPAAFIIILLFVSSSEQGGGGGEGFCKTTTTTTTTTTEEEYNNNNNNNNMATTTLGGIQDTTTNSNSVDTQDLARFAVDQHNTKQNALLEFVRVVKSQEQVVAGTLHHLTLEVIDAGTKKLYEAKVWVKPWLNFKELQEFKHIEGDSPAAASCFTSSDLGAHKGEQPSGWKSVAVHDPVIQDAAHHAVHTIQQRSNSLLPYQLSEVVHANAEVVESSAKFDMLIKVKRGEKEEKFKVEVHKDHEGAFRLNKMEGADHS